MGESAAADVELTDALLPLHAPTIIVPVTTRSNFFTEASCRRSGMLHNDSHSWCRSCMPTASRRGTLSQRGPLAAITVRRSD